ncbi:DUF3500 domain-containing protein [Tenggerimyces flavus]|uniref:DUF3500 domain-containing protein n=1 Tax=Tenggerimyces flavus TaxID=1708749 RepID=A0ABV7Y3D0_9ACTN|nr:DUF3500 domain-containing protein [Tenggerimyces flavus]MBM7788696.1 hypothetical protein [Tenggerimyces flavus]
MTAQTMTQAAQAFLASLDDGQRAQATAPFDTPDHREWTYVPGPRPGLRLKDMSEEQRRLAFALLDTGLSERAQQTARGIIGLEPILGELERVSGTVHFERDPELYWFRVLGTPGAAEPWAWRTNGHHIAIHVTVVGDDVAVTPHFFGANPARVPSGPQEGLRALPDEEDLGRALVLALDDDRRKIAIVAETAPDDIMSRMDPVVDRKAMPSGLAYGDMTDDQRELLRGLVRHYLTRPTPALADEAWARVEGAGLEPVTFTWAGSLEPGIGNGHYYNVLGPTFLLEYDNTQNNANHIHSVWRDFANDWGEDLLAKHYATDHREDS